MKIRTISVFLVSSHRVLECTGGVESFTFSLCKALESLGHECRVIHRTLNMPFFVARSTASSRRETLTRIQEKRPNALISTLSMIYFSTMLFLYLLHWVKKENPHILHSQDPIFAGVPTVFASYLTRRPAIVHCHGSVSQPHRHKPRSVLWAIERFYYLWTIRSGSMFIVTDSTTAWLLGEDQLPKSRCQVIPSFSDLGQISRQKVHGEDILEKPVVGFVGRLERVKRVDVLIGAISILRREGINISCLVVGDGSARDELEASAEKLGVRDAIVFTGRKSNVVPYLLGMDIFALPSESEGSPLSLLEAMSLGLPCVVTNLTSLREIVTEHEARFFKPGSPDDLAAVLRNLISDPALMRNLGDSAAERATGFGTGKIVHRYLTVYYEECRAHSVNRL